MAENEALPSYFGDENCMCSEDDTLGLWALMDANLIRISAFKSVDMYTPGRCLRAGGMLAHDIMYFYHSVIAYVLL